VFIVYFVSDGYLNDARLFRNNIINMKELFDAYSIIVNAIFLGNYGDTKKKTFIVQFHLHIIHQKFVDILYVNNVEMI
jgi:hypothetical protein